MAKYNIYKIKDGKVNELSEHLVSDRRYRIVSSNVLTGYNVRTYFAGPDDANMWWLDQYGDLFFDNNSSKHNQIYSGAIIASKDANGYILPFGKTHFYIQEFIEYNFGLEMAEKIADPNQAKMKSLKRFGGKTSKSLISYTTGSSLDFSSGDSAEYLKLRPQSADDWGTSFIHFGTSIQFGSLDVEPSDLGDLLQRIDSAYSSRRKFEIPLMRQPKLIDLQ